MVLSGLPEGLLLWDYTTWPLWFGVTFSLIILLGVEILSFIVLNGFSFGKPIAVKGKHLDKLEFIDTAFVYFNRFTMIPFVYHLIQVIYYTDGIKKLPEEATWMNTLGALVLFYIFYDFFYHVSVV